MVGADLDCIANEEQTALETIRGTAATVRTSGKKGHQHPAETEEKICTRLLTQHSSLKYFFVSLRLVTCGEICFPS